MIKFVLVCLLSSLATLTSAQLVLPGGEHALATNDEMLVRVLAEVQPLLNSQLNSPYLHRVSHVVNATAQIVNGLIYHVTFDLGQTGCLKSVATTTQQQSCDTYTQSQRCSAKIFSQPWDNVLELSELQCAEPKKTTTDTLDGGLYEVDTEDATMKHALLAMEQQMSDQFNSLYVSQVGKVLEAKAQIVAGIKYYLTFKFGQTYLLKSKQHEEPHHARSEVIRKLETCHAQIWAKPGGEQFELLEFRCEVSGEFYAGGVHSIAVNDADMLGSLHAVEGAMNAQLHSAYLQSVGRVIEAKAQVVSGMKYLITFEFGQQAVDGQTVVLLNAKICHAEIWSQPWLAKNELTSLKCD